MSQDLGGGTNDQARSNGAASPGYGTPSSGDERAAASAAVPPKPQYDPHPLFELGDGEVECRDIVLLSFKRKNAEGELVPQPESIPAKEVKSWADVERWWGGGRYLVTARNAKGYYQGRFPDGKDLYFIDGPEKPFMARDRTQVAGASAAAAAAPVPPPPSSAPPAPPLDPVQVMQDIAREIRDEMRDLRARPPASVLDPVQVMKDIAREIRDEMRDQRAPAAAQPNPGIEMMVQMFKQQGEETRARVTEAAAKAKADAEVRIAEINAASAQQNAMWAALKSGHKEGGGDSTLVTLLMKMIPPPMDPLAFMKAAKDAGGPAATESDPLKSITELVGSLVSADAMKTQSQPQTQAAAPPPPREEARPRGRMEYVPGVGVVEVHAPEHRVTALAAAPAAPAAPPAPAAAPSAAPAAAPAAPRPPAEPAEPLVAPTAVAPAAPPAAPAEPPAAPAAAAAAAPPAPPAAPAEPSRTPTVAPVVAPTISAGALPAPAAPAAPASGTVASPDHAPTAAPSERPKPSLAEMRAEVSGILRRMKGQPEAQRVAFLSSLPPFAAQAATLAPILGALSEEDIDAITQQIGIGELQGILALQQRTNGVARHGG